MIKQSEVVILLSGGIDSMACIPFFKDKNLNITALFCNYGQLSLEQEKSSAKAIAHFYRVNFDIINCEGLPKINGGEIISRNALLLNIALYNLQKKPGLISLGIHSGTGYVDCSEIFINKMQSIFDLYTDGTIRISTPFINWTKKDIWDYCMLKKAPLNLTYSCELGKKQPCGICNSCKDLEVIYAC